MKRFLLSRPVAVLVAIGMSVALAACGSGGNAAPDSKNAQVGVPPKTVGYLDILKAGAYQKRNYDVFAAGAAALGWTVKYKDAAGDPAAAQEAVQGFVTQRVDAIIDSAADTSFIRPGLLAAQKANIPVINIAGQDRPGPAHQLLAADYGEDEAGLAGPIAKKIFADLPAGSKIAVLKTSLLFAAQPRQRVIDEGAVKAGVTVVEDVEMPLDAAPATKKITDLLTAHPDLNALVPVFDLWTAPAVDAVKRAKREDKLKIYGFYADTINAPLMRKNPNFVALTDGNQAAGAIVALDQLLYHFAKNKPIDPAPAEARYEYNVFTQNTLPPPGQDGPQSAEALVAPFITKWKADFPKKSSGQ